MPTAILYDSTVLFGWTSYRALLVFREVEPAQPQCRDRSVGLVAIHVPTERWQEIRGVLMRGSVQRIAKTNATQRDFGGVSRALSTGRFISSGDGQKRALCIPAMLDSLP